MNREDVEALKTHLAELEEAIAETEKRLPAHSVKPPVMHDLLALEDERDAVLRTLALMPKSDPRETR